MKESLFLLGFMLVWSAVAPAAETCEDVIHEERQSFLQELKAAVPHRAENIDVAIKQNLAQYARGTPQSEAFIKNVITQTRLGKASLADQGSVLALLNPEKEQEIIEFFRVSYFREALLSSKLTTRRFPFVDKIVTVPRPAYFDLEYFDAFYSAAVEKAVPTVFRSPTDRVTRIVSSELEKRLVYERAQAILDHPFGDAVDQKLFENIFTAKFEKSFETSRAQAFADFKGAAFKSYQTQGLEGLKKYLQSTLGAARGTKEYEEIMKSVTSNPKVLSFTLKNADLQKIFETQGPQVLLKKIMEDRNWWDFVKTDKRQIKAALLAIIVYDQIFGIRRTYQKGVALITGRKDPAGKLTPEDKHELEVQGVSKDVIIYEFIPTLVEAAVLQGRKSIPEACASSELKGKITKLRTKILNSQLSPEARQQELQEVAVPLNNLLDSQTHELEDSRDKCLRALREQYLAANKKLK